MSVDGSTIPTVTDGSTVGGVLDRLRGWLSRFILVTDDLDLALLTLWAAHTHVAHESYTTPRLILDSAGPGAGKTTVLEHLMRFCNRALHAASLSSPAMLGRLLDKELRTILIDEADRALDPKRPGVEELIAMLNSGYKRGATRPVLVPSENGWDVVEMPTFAPVAMAGNAPQLPDDTRSRSIRVLLMPDLFGVVEATDWEELEEDAAALTADLANVMDTVRDFIRTTRPELPEGCVGRLKEKWGPLARVAAAAGGEWPHITNQLIERDVLEVLADREDGLTRRPPGVVLLDDLFTVWDESEPFVPTKVLVSRLVDRNSQMWGSSSGYGRELTVQRFGRLIVQASKVHSSKNAQDVRGYSRDAFVKAWRQLGITPRIEPSEIVGTVEPSRAGVVAAGELERGA
jgi:hypothetical protein